MSTRVEKLEQLHKSLKKHFKFVEGTTERTVLEHLLYACCLEDARTEQADEAFAKLQQTYFDWNEVRVTTVIELGEVLSSLPNASAAGHRIKRCLQSLFETRYQFDIEDMKKANLGKATEEIQAWPGMTPFVLNYTVQHALGGHSIPVDTMTMEALWSAGIITDSELEKKSVPGVERAVAKNKGFEFAALLHQFAVEFGLNRKNANALAVFKDLGVTAKPKFVPPAPEPSTKPKKGDAKPDASGKGKAPAPAAAAPTTAHTSKNAPKTEAKDLASVKQPPAPAPTPAKGEKVDAKAASKPLAPTKEVAPAKTEKAKAAPPKTPDKPKDVPKAKDSKDAPKATTSKPAAAKTEDKKPAAPAKSIKAEKPVSAEKSSQKPKPPAGKPAAKETAKPAKKPEKTEKKPEPKKAAPAAKKPTKMANNVKITKKKPK